MADYFGSQYDDTIVIGGAGSGVTYGGSSKGRKLAKKTFEDKLADYYDNFAYAGEGNDKVYGSSDDDAVDGGNGDDLIYGGKGNDLLVGGNGKDVVYGGSGDDMIGATNATGSTSDNGSDRLIGDGVDTLDGKGQTAALDSFGNDSIFGGNAKDEIWGDAEGDDGSANGGNDILFGNNGDDAIHGGGGGDEIEGENGADQLWGGKGGDIFGYNSVAESNAAGFDTIWDFTDFSKAGSEYDIIDLTAFGGALVWGDTDATKGGVWHKVISGDTFVYADTNGDGAADLTIKLAGIHDLKDNNFLGVINKDDGDATVSISGTAAEHEILTANFGDDDPDGPASGVSYQWQRDGVDIGGAMASTYTLVADDVGSKITVVVNYTDGQGFAEIIESDETATVVAVDDGDATVTISGTTAEHEVLTANFGDDDPDGTASGVSYQWQRDGADIGGATGSTYTLVADDVGSKITVVVNYTDGQGFAEIIESDETATVIAVDDGDATVSLSGTAAEHQVLTANFGDDDPDGAASGVGYQWQRDGVDIGGATGSTYTLVADDIGSQITVVVSYTDGQGFVETIESDSTAPVIAVDDGDATVSISGTAAEHQVLTANFGDDDPDGAASGVGYQWQRDGADIGSATGSTYTLVADDVGSKITVVVNYTDGQGFAEIIESDETATVVAVDDGDATVSISGTAAEHQVLTANFGDDDPDGPASGVSYQWQRDGADIPLATGSTYTLVADDVGSKITVVVNYTDGQGFGEIIESDETATVVAVDDGDATVSISGTAAEHQVLTANFGDDDPDGLASGVSYQWQRDGADIGGATGSTYTLVADDVGAQITVVVTYTDGQGFAETIESDPTAAVLAVDDGDATVSISGTAEVGALLTANFGDDDPDGSASGVSYRWQRNGVDIGGATSSTYTLAVADVGALITAVVGYTDGQGFAEEIESDATDPVASSNEDPTDIALRVLITGAFSGAPGAGSTIGTLTTVDPDDPAGTGSYAYSLQSGTSSVFSIGGADGDQVVTSSALGAGTYALVVKTEDGSGGNYTETINVFVGKGAGDDPLPSNPGDDGDDIIYGLNGTDVIYGGKGNDQLFGQSGTDTLNGNEDDDLLYGGADADTLSGGAGNDVFLYRSADESSLVDPLGSALPTKDTILDFTPGSDRIDLSAFNFTGAAHDAIKESNVASFTAVNVSDLFDDGGVDRAVVVQYFGGNAQVYVDVNKDGNFDTTNDITIRLNSVGAGTLDVADFQFTAS